MSMRRGGAPVQQRTNIAEGVPAVLHTHLLTFLTLVELAVVRRVSTVWLQRVRRACRLLQSVSLTSSLEPAAFLLRELAGTTGLRRVTLIGPLPEEGRPRWREYSAEVLMALLAQPRVVTPSHL